MKKLKPVIKQEVMFEKYADLEEYLIFEIKNHVGYPNMTYRVEQPKNRKCKLEIIIDEPMDFGERTYANPRCSGPRTL